MPSLISILLSQLLIVQQVTGFLFNNHPQHSYCYALDLENCFREAFLSATHPPDRLKRHSPVPLFRNGNVTVLEKTKHARDLGAKHLMMCHDVRRFSACFSFPACTDQMAAQIASVQYHMVFGKKLPVQVFLSYKGFGKQICEQACARESMQSCRRKLSPTEAADEQAYLLEAASIAQHLTTGRDREEGVCDRFRKAITHVIKVRQHYCGDAAKCTCTDATIKQGLSFCHLDCDFLAMERTHALPTDASSTTTMLAAITVIVLGVRM